MDLVKSHVTFAVRQEVEELKTTITTLQAKVFHKKQLNVIAFKKLLGYNVGK